ncbi:uncharacterized protein LOC118747008 isoform X1 [Rhagoletis pomonella]|uniref:uncharacterized protein LOC118747008 isoform X1 n=1 Tax=Rhagoletis pomonella TaxID=28610 RepID=UPI00177D154E|nr:uncharacterized protein LOC118747008 isoform X1 [Rhagoletis pomonella]
MTHQRTSAALTAINYHQIWFALFVSIMWLAHDACALPVVGSVNTLTGGMPRHGTRQQIEMQQLLLNELLNNVNDDTLYNELKKYQRQQPNYLSKWPGLRDLLLIPDYGEDVGDDSGAADDSYEAANTRFIERLRQLAANAVDGIDDARADSQSFGPPTMPLKKKPHSAPAAFKDHGIKKNIQLHKQYMSPCHFKICNMGRKRNARFFED